MRLKNSASLRGAAAGAVKCGLMAKVGGVGCLDLKNSRPLLLGFRLLLSLEGRKMSTRQ
jgi:hypothetical protein